jgi:PKD repeat protein
MDFFGYPLGTNGLVANFETDKSSVLPGEEIQFIDWSISDESNPVNSWMWDFNSDGTIDSEEQNPMYTYQEGGLHDVTLIVSNGVSTDTMVKNDAVGVRAGILVYEGKDVSGYSGEFINNFLHDYAYEEISYTHKFPEALDGYDVVLLSFGNSGNQVTDLTPEMVSEISSYGFDGGRIYLEGSDAISENPDLWTIFGLIDADGGTSNMMTDLTGTENALTYGLEFTGSTQFSINTIDNLAPVSDPAVEPAFNESDYGIVAVQVDASETTGHKAFGFSYALADLIDGEGMNTRNELLLRILNFFDIVSDVDENIIAENQLLKVFPNPSSEQITLEMESPVQMDANIYLYDLSGRIVLMENSNINKGKNRISFNIGHLPDGLYYFNLRSDSHNETIKWLKVQ